MQKPPNQFDQLQIALKNFQLLWSPILELYYGYKSNTIPWQYCSGWLLFASGLLILKIDRFLISLTPLKSLYPYYPLLYKIYVFSFMTMMFWVWAWNQVRLKRQKLSMLTAAFKNAGLQSKIGRIPNLISDFSLDPIIRKMRITNAGFPISKFQEQAKYLESELGIFIDFFKEDRESRVVSIIYSHFPMAEHVLYAPAEAKNNYEFIVGKTRAHTLTANFRDTPHLLIAGQTGGGKSTFLRQLIVHIAVNHKSARFLLVDLKGGLEFSLFEKRKQFNVVPSVLAAIEEVKIIDKLLTDRMHLLKSDNSKDIDTYIKKKRDTAPTYLHRQFVVVDEAAEMFLAGHHANSKDIQVARGILSKIARQGRAVGVHLIVATQRPDSKSLDPQVKANLTGVICFQMMNDASSIAVLGNGRATDLPKVPGRAIWKNGIEMLEVQTPFLSAEEAEVQIGPIAQKSESENASSAAAVFPIVVASSTTQTEIPLLNGSESTAEDLSGIETN